MQLISVQYSSKTAASPAVCLQVLQEQLLQLYKLAVKDDQLMVTIVHIQQQREPEDCGLYSIATAYDAALHKEHHTVTYKQEEMRHHLEMCFRGNKIN